MPTYEFLCEKCNVITENFMSIHSTSEDKAKVKCGKCKGDTIQTFTESAGFIFNEGDLEESAKPGSYWRNAEKNKQDRIEKAKKEEQEKLHYGDKATVAKHKRRATNRMME